MPARTLPLIEDVDPLEIQPPVLETLEERNARLAIENRAKSISDKIDEELERERIAERKNPKPIKILLLGQSESGKSTTLKNFQLLYDLKSFRAERASWRAVIQLNVVRSVYSILNAMSRALPTEDDLDPMSSVEDNIHVLPKLTPELIALRNRLLPPLQQAERILTQRLTAPGSGETEATRLGEKPPSRTTPSRSIFKEVAINSAIPWKRRFNRLLMKGDRSSFESQDGVDWDDPEDPGAILYAAGRDMIQLWASPIIHDLLEKQNVRLEELSGFFLDSLERVTSRRYLPNDDDILRARLKTLGVSEHRFKISNKSGPVRDWRVYDVGGHRSQRAAWAPFFDDMDAIIFLAPVSCFDQVLEEDHKVNRLEDSFKLWSMIVTNPHLKHTNLILFLNKIDILRTKLAAGIRLRDYVVSYGDRPNDVESTTSYLKRKFGGILQDKSPLPRVFYCHFTTVTDTHSTKLVIGNLKDMLMRQNLQKTNLIN